MKKTSVILSIAAISMLSSTAALAIGANTYVGAQIGMTSLQTENNTDTNNLNLYGAMIGTTVRDMFSADINFVNQGNYFHAMADMYYNHSLSPKITSRLGGGVGVIHFNETDSTNAVFIDGGDQDATSKFAYQGAFELDYSVSDTLGFFSGYHYVGWQDSNTDQHANEYLFGMHYFL